MDISDAFEPGHDATGRRLRSLSLYGVDQSFRATDGFALALERVVTCAAHFSEARGSDITIWSGDDEPPTLARAGERPVDRNPVRSPDAWASPDQPHLIAAEAVAVHDVQSATTIAAAPLIGQERVVLGVLTVWWPGPVSVESHTRWLLEHLARAAMTTLDDRRRVVARRRVTSPPLRVVGRTDRRCGPTGGPSSPRPE